MNFETLNVQAVRSITQRCLLWYWNELAARRRFPAFSEFQLDARMHDHKALAIWSVERSASRLDFRAQYQGLWLSHVFRNHWVGKTMDEVMPLSVRQYSLKTANECAGKGCAVFTIISTVDLEGHRVQCERLLLPFGTDSKVERILASYYLISLEGNFERGTVLDLYRATSKVELAGRIPSGFIKPAIARPRNVVRLHQIEEGA